MPSKGHSKKRKVGSFFSLLLLFGLTATFVLVPATENKHLVSYEAWSYQHLYQENVRKMLLPALSMKMQIVKATWLTAALQAAEL